MVVSQLSAFWTKVNIRNYKKILFKTLGTFSTSSPSCNVNKGSKLKQQSSEKWILESLSDAYTYYSYCYHVEDNMRVFSLFASNSLDWTNVAFSCNFILLKCSQVFHSDFYISRWNVFKVYDRFSYYLLHRWRQTWTTDPTVHINVSHFHNQWPYRFWFLLILL